MTDRAAVADDLRLVARRLADLYAVDRGAIRRLRADLALDREVLDGLTAWGVDLPAASGRGKGSPRRIAGYAGQAGAEGDSLRAPAKVPETSDKGAGDLGHGEGPRPCHLCGREFVAGRVDARYCSPRCTDLASRERRGQDISEQLAAILDPPRCQAPGCGDIIPSWRKGKCYCGEGCRKAAYRARGAGK